VFFLPSDVTQNKEQPAPEENAKLQCELQEEPSNENTTNTQVVFFGGYAFFKLRVSLSPSASQPNDCTLSAPVTDGQQQSIPPPFKFLEEETELKPLPPTVSKRSSENLMHIQQDSKFEQIKDKDLQIAVLQRPKKQTQLLQDQPLSLQVHPSLSILKLPDLTLEDLPSQAPPSQAALVQAHWVKPMLAKPPSHATRSYNLTVEDLPSHDIPPKDTPSQDMLSQSPSAQALLSVAPTSRVVQLPNIHLLQQSPGLQPQNIQPGNQQFLQVAYQDIQSEVTEGTKDWKFDAGLHGKKFSKQHSLDLQRKSWQFRRRHSLDLQSKGRQSPRRRALGQRIKNWLSSKRHSIDKQVQQGQTMEHLPDQQDEDRQDKGEQSPKGQPKDELNEDGQTDKEQPPKQQTQDQHTEDARAQEEKSTKEQSQNRQAEGQQAQVEKTPKQLCLDWASRVQDYQFWQFPKSNLQTPQPKTGDLLAKTSKTGELKAGETKIGKHRNGNLKCSTP
ncbi:LOW QUALITY PROTEIN: membrane-spanning 4-domains subfamily A member 14, partial [Carlito syrichta]|uniref:LOW QUALITY PROTEIN: membrane-spanning 4-domains subfamily A member 14 n=1 Tax=Carlito syrichta TaxID=1868482 RepID=A0A1U7UIL4_CARSF